MKEKKWMVKYLLILRENPQWAMPCYSKTNLVWRYPSLEKKKKDVFRFVKIGLGPMKAVYLESLRHMWRQNLFMDLSGVSQRHWS